MASWFRQRRLGYFVTPATWQGWAVMIAMLLFLVYHAASTGRITVLVTIMFLVVAISLILGFARSSPTGDGADAE